MMFELWFFVGFNQGAILKARLPYMRFLFAEGLR